VHLAFSAPKEGSNASFARGSSRRMRRIHWRLTSSSTTSRAAGDRRHHQHIHYANDNLAANAYVDPQILTDPAVYPTPAMEARLYQSREAGPALERLRTRPGRVSRRRCE